MNNTTSSINTSILPVHIPNLRIVIVLLCFLLYIIGYTGCLLSILTFSSKKLRRHSTGFLFLIMAFVDMFNLIGSLQYFLDVIYQINIQMISIHWCRLLTIFNYELYFGFSWIFAFISIDRWIKVEWPSKSQTLCTRQRFLHLCLLTLMISLIENFIYTFLCLSDRCEQKNLICEIFIHTIYIIGYMIIPIALILVSISRTCLITLHVKKRFRPPKQRSRLLSSNQSTLNVPRHSTLTRTSRSTSSSFNSDLQQHLPRSSNVNRQRRRRRSGLDTQMVILISINVAPFIFVHIITEIAYLFEKYSSFVAQSRVAQLSIILIYLSWYFISATRFYTNCLLSRIYREEFKNRIYSLRYGCRPRIIIVEHVPTHRYSSRPYIESMVNGLESTTTPNM